MKTAAFAIPMLAMGLLLMSMVPNEGKKDAGPEAWRETVRKGKCLVLTYKDFDRTVSATHNGETFYFCCQGCLKKFKKNPAKYLGGGEEKKDPPSAPPPANPPDPPPEKKAEPPKKEETPPKKEEEKKEPEKEPQFEKSIREGKCIVLSQKEYDRSISCDYKGRTFYFCCSGCLRKFQANPAKYLK